MKRAIVVLAFLVSSCASVKAEVIAITKPPKPVGVEEIVLKQLNAGAESLCYVTKDGVEFRSDRVECPPQAETERIIDEVVKLNKIHKKRLEGLTVFYTADIIDCNGTIAMGCTQPFDDGTAISVVSLYYPWRRMILRHELTHVALFWNNAPEMRHFCLDNPSLCNGEGDSLLLPKEAHCD